MSQNELILDYLERNGSITQAEAIEKLGCYRLGARIWELKNERGIQIRRMMVDGTNRFGERTRYAKYYTEGKSGAASDTVR